MKNKIKFFYIFTILISLMTFSKVFAVEADVQINGEIIDFTDSNGNKVNAQIINSRTMVPLRKIFEVLGCEIVWDNDSRSVTASKNDKEIFLQINNKVATITEAGIEKKITLDTAPVIINNRTLVPLRFIAESLEKQVGWDSSSYTAIIIDYDYFADLIRQKNINLYNVLSSKGSMEFSVTRDYLNTFGYTPIKDTAIIKGTILKESDCSKISINFEGDNELIKEITSEGWNNLIYDAKYIDNKFSIKTSNETLAKILSISVNEYKEFDLENLSLIGTLDGDISMWIRSIFDVKETKLYVSTFDKMKVDFEKFLNLFIENGTRNLNYANAELVTFDYTNFDKVVYGNEVSRNLSFINKKIFNYDIIQDEFLYDWKNINYNMNVENNKLLLKITLENEYNEKVSYTVMCKSI